MRLVETLAEFYFLKAAEAKLSAAGATDPRERRRWENVALEYNAKALRARPSNNIPNRSP